jgi:hypothetical protein
MKQAMYLDQDKWREFSVRAGEKVETPHAVVRFSRKLLVAGALFLIIIGFCDVL